MILHTLRSGDIKTNSKLEHGGLCWHYFPNKIMFHACWHIGQATKFLCGWGGGKAQNRCNKIACEDEVPKRRKKSPLGLNL